MAKLLVLNNNSMKLSINQFDRVCWENCKIENFLNGTRHCTQSEWMDRSSQVVVQPTLQSPTMILILIKTTDFF